MRNESHDLISIRNPKESGAKPIGKRLETHRKTSQNCRRNESKLPMKFS